MVLAFEGWDAGGKGGAIKRLTQALDPRGYQVNPVAAPNDAEKHIIICGVSGNSFQRMVMWQYLTVPGMAALWLRESKASVRKKNGSVLTTR